MRDGKWRRSTAFQRKAFLDRPLCKGAFENRRIGETAGLFPMVVRLYRAAKARNPYSEETARLLAELKAEESALRAHNVWIGAV